MRAERVYDGSRRAVWREALGPGEVALFFVDAETGRARNEFGRKPEAHWQRRVLVCSGLDEAVAFAGRKVREVPGLACRIYGRDGEAPLRVVVDADPRPEDDPRRMARRALWGVALLAIGVAFIWAGWVWSWFLILGAIVGIKFLTVGVARLAEGVINYRAARGPRNRAR